MKALYEQAQRDFPDLGIRVDEELAFYKELTQKVRSREEAASVRFTRGKTRLPSGLYLPWVETDPKDQSYKNTVGFVSVPLVLVSHVIDFPEKFALLDAYQSKREMIDDIESIYKTTLQPLDVISAYVIGNIVDHTVLF